MKNKIVYFTINVSIFILLLWLSKGKSGGDIFLILSYSILTVIQFIYCLLFAKIKEDLIGIIAGIIISVFIFKVVDNQQSKQEIKVINENLKIS
jgi:tryptophan-rich sensory protein